MVCILQTKKAFFVDIWKMNYGFTAQPYVSELVFGIIFFYAIGIWNISKDFQANQFFQENYQLQFLATELSFLEKKLN